MAVALYTVKFSNDSGLTRDQTVNTFWYASAASGNFTSIDKSNHADAIRRFFQDAPPLFANPLDYYMSPRLQWSGAARPAVWCADYDVATETLSPAAEIVKFAETTGPPAGTAGLPLEVSLCGSYQGSDAIALPPARKRGRLYIGPLSTGAMSTVAGGENAPSSDFRGTLGAALKALAGKSSGNGGALTANWCVHSRASNAFSVISQGWVDNAWDTQRRRGERATVRTAWAV